MRSKKKEIEVLMEISESDLNSENSTDASQTEHGKLPFNSLVLSILGITSLANSAYAILAPFLPF